MDWKLKAKIVSILYMIVEGGERFSVMADAGSDEAFILDDLRQLFNHGYLEIFPGNTHYSPTEKAKQYLNGVVDMINHVLPYEIFGAVTVERALTEDERDDSNPLMPASNVFDPRFVPSEASTDMRLAIITWLNETAQGEQIDPHFVVFLQKLGAGLLRVESGEFWSAIMTGDAFREIEEIVRTAYKWREASAVEDESASVMQTVYTAGMLETQKREGNKCSGCGTPLAVYEQYAREAGTAFEECPNPACGASFKQRQAVSQGMDCTCPNCNADMSSSWRRCHSCHAIVDKSMDEGSVSTTTTETVIEETYVTECYAPCWSYDYGYYGVAPVYYYDPYDPLIAATALTCLAVALW